MAPGCPHRESAVVVAPARAQATSAGCEHRAGPLPVRRGAGVAGGWWTSRTVSRILCRAVPPGGRSRSAAAIHLGTPLPAPSSRPPSGCPDGRSTVAAYPGARAGSPRTLPVWPCSGWGLPSRAGHPARWWSLTPPFHPCPGWSLDEPGRSVLCGTFPRVAPGGRYPPPCPVESGLSSAGVASRRGRPSGSSACSLALRGLGGDARCGGRRRLGREADRSGPGIGLHEADPDVGAALQRTRAGRQDRR